MKKYLQLTAMLLFTVLAFSQNKDLPNPVADPQTLPAGSYIIAMDNTNQVNTAGYFNLKSYGLVVFLLNRNIKIKWVIKAGKLKDGIDFTASASKLKPIALGAAIHDFKAGPFVIFAADTAGVSILIDSFYLNPTGGSPAVPLTGNNRPSVYKTTADVPNVDIRYNLTDFKPKAAILKDGGNEDIHVGFMGLAGIPDTNWRVNLGQNLIISCFTFASEPHNDKVGTPDFDIAIHGIRAFVEFGGNFLAQCAAVESYENHIDHGYLQTSTGITHHNAHYSNDKYSNSDLGFAQYDGYYHSTQTGHLQSWDINSSWVNNGYVIQNDPNIIGGINNIGASVSKFKDPDTRGGMVFYLGNHDFKNMAHLEDINGIRMYMNAFLTPVAINQFCTITPPLPISWYSFSATRYGVQVNLEWKTASETNNKYFYPERSADGVHFIALAKLNGAVNSNKINTYTFNDVPGTGIFYYRIRQEDIDGKTSYSITRIIKVDSRSGSSLYIYPNPNRGVFSITFGKDYIGRSMLLFDETGRQVYRQDKLMNAVTQQLNLANLSSGVYTAVFFFANNSEKITEKIVIVK
ncbi:MAG: T9SS type A sorting domain-containing protein [Ferruginibacter sp.]|nr:T9SS type A sorting domain-containing protein [Chitinophagaceae bacterium]